MNTIDSVAENFETLVARVAERELFLKTILDFVQSFVREHGTTTKYEEYSDYVNIDMNLIDFNGFDIIWSQGRSSRIELFYFLSERLNFYTKRPTLVFSMNYWSTGVDGCEVLFFHGEKSWEKAFLSTAARANEHLAYRNAEQTQAQQDAEKDRREKEAMKQLIKKAKRLGLR